MPEAIRLEHLTIVPQRNRTYLDATLTIKEGKIASLMPFTKLAEDISVKTYNLQDYLILPLPVSLKKAALALPSFVYCGSYDTLLDAPCFEVFFNQQKVIAFDVFRFTLNNLHFILRNLSERQLIIDDREHDLFEQMRYLRSLGYPFAQIAAYATFNYYDYLHRSHEADLLKGHQADFALFTSDMKLSAVYKGAEKCLTL